MRVLLIWPVVRRTTIFFGGRSVAYTDEKFDGRREHDDH
jgi:hypothetical protein